MPTEQEWMDVRDRLRYEVEHPNTRVNQLHRNEWPKLWRVIDEIVSEDFVLGSEEEDLTEHEIPVAVTFEEDVAVAMESLPELPEIPDPGEDALPDVDPVSDHGLPPDEEAEDRNHPNVITSGPIPPPSRSRGKTGREGFDEFSLPEQPE